MEILDNLQIKNKIKRIAYQIIESNFETDIIYLLGINNNGFNFAKILEKKLKKISNKEIKIARLTLKPQNPVESEIKLDLDEYSLNNKCIIVVDDVANTGRTLFYAMKVLMDILPEKVETVVLVDRKHKSFPVFINYFGLSLATTIQENIKVDLSDPDNYKVSLK